MITTMAKIQKIQEQETVTLFFRSLQFCAKRFFNLLQAIFRSPENDFPFCGKRFSG